MIINNLGRDIDCKSIAEVEYHRIKKDSQKYFHFSLPKEEHMLNIRFASPENIWSPPFYLDRIGRTFLRLSSVDMQNSQVVRADTIIRKATFVVLLTESSGPLQYLIENQLGVPIIVNQKVSHKILFDFKNQ
jgi:hypothetical protein